ncbi:MAG: DNA-binding protein [Candidatus Omnitrophica bacterium]|nr:DNA-binding protein [Candidatus Omnitrophota bacterium]MBU1869012.1 DNA-binding protein [Candidatus Omnitrophota bacterium]
MRAPQIIFLACALCLLACEVFAQPVSSVELITNDKLYDGKTVTYSGEVIGDVMKRGKFAWANVFDGKRAIGVWAPAGLVKGIRNTGSYKSTGDKVEVTGIFNRACPEHGGDLDLHAQELVIVQPGHEVTEKIKKNEIVFAVILLLILGLIWISHLYKHR